MAAFIGGAILMALVAVGLSGLPWSLQVLMAATALGAGGLALHRLAPGSRHVSFRLEVTRDGRVLCGTGPDSQSLMPATIIGHWTLAGRVAGLVLEGDDGRRVHAFVFRDQLAPGQWRYLNRALRLGRA